MRIETYFQQLQDTIESCLVVQSSNITYDKRTTHEGFIHGELYFVDGSILHLREFLDVETTIDRLMYVYHYMDATNKLIFRYDNTGHHRKLNLPTYPHHKHEGHEDNIIASSASDLATVLNEIEQLVQLP
ncbi:MAG: hypothetical protein JW953_02470 [Anaerolineae bacterium]|nr:hypothetical protein [Anaerolineae bacterium]